MTAKEVFANLIKLVTIEQQREEIVNKLDTVYPFDECCWHVGTVYYNCEIKEGTLYDNEGDILSDDGGCMNEEIPYFVNQYCGYCGDDYSGTMFIKVDDNGTYVSVHYEC